ncbi:LmeA family phospholipid-binding protein [Streptomyces sp. NPDC088847]|uniref:LmeA family phospholipid-binding protein n=1 Tax=Streptomyces sp. NPDC088847 TaxID=3365909 RepID=UPI003819571E
MDSAAANGAERRVAAAFQDATDTPQEPRVTIHGFPVLAQVAGSRSHGRRVRTRVHAGTGETNRRPARQGSAERTVNRFKDCRAVVTLHAKGTPRAPAFILAAPSPRHPGS